jgi:hypothetical protein
MSDQGAIPDATEALLGTEDGARRGLDMLDRALADIESGGFDDEELAGYAGW